MIATPATLYHRAYQVLIGSLDTPNQVAYGNVGTYAPLRIAFSIQKSMFFGSNKGKITISNMAPRNRDALRRGMLVTLSAGYLGAMQTLFVGLVERVVTQRQGPDTQTDIECLDGGGAISQATFHSSYGPGTPILQVFTDVAAAMQLRTAANPAGMDIGSLAGIQAEVLTAPLSVAGSCRAILTDLCTARGLEWCITNNALQITARGGHTGATAEVVSAQTGLTGIPSCNFGITRFSALLNPRILPGSLVQLKSTSVNGFYKVRNGTWEGDTHGDKWGCDIEALEVSGVSVLP